MRFTRGTQAVLAAAARSRLGTRQLSDKPSPLPNLDAPLIVRQISGVS